MKKIAKGVKILIEVGNRKIIEFIKVFLQLNFSEKKNVNFNGFYNFRIILGTVLEIRCMISSTIRALYARLVSEQLG